MKFDDFINFYKKSEYIKEDKQGFHYVETKDIINFIKAQKFVVMLISNDMSSIYISFDDPNYRLPIHRNVWEFIMDPFSFRSFSLVFRDSYFIKSNITFQYPRIKYQKNYQIKQDIIKYLYFDVLGTHNIEDLKNQKNISESFIYSVLKDYKQKSINVLSNLIMDFNYINPTIEYITNYYNNWINLNKIIIYYFGIYSKYDKIIKFCIDNNIENWKILSKFDKIPGINKFEWDNFKYFLNNFQNMIEGLHYFYWSHS